jgi:hypothetical protein
MDLDQFIKKEVGIRAEFLSDFVYLFRYKNKFIFPANKYILRHSFLLKLLRYGLVYLQLLSQDLPKLRLSRQFMQSLDCSF